MDGIKGITYVTAASVVLSVILFAWYAFGTPLTGFNLALNSSQFAIVGVGILICFAAYALSKPDF
ncbi:MAG: hypothetical protein RBQ94_02815 [Methanimicrococcus sp.]|nr:hypothetical protein [Methanimicrococcus sp.]